MTRTPGVLTRLVGFVKHGERALVLRLRGELEILDVLGDDLSVGDEETLTYTEQSE